MQPIDYARPSRRPARPVARALAILAATFCLVVGAAIGSLALATLLYGGDLALIFFAVLYGSLFFLAGWFLMREAINVIRGTSDTDGESR